jgi:hypothetical protein
MKRIFISVLTVLVALIISTAFTSCTHENPGSTPKEQKPQPGENTD